MRHLLWLCVTLFASAPSAPAQDCCPKVELFGGYSYLISGSPPGTSTGSPIDSRVGAHGFGVNVAANLSSKLGFVADASYQVRDIQDLAGSLNLKSVYFLFGPRFATRDQGVTFFGEALVGGRRTSIDDVSLGRSYTALAFGVGGGLDLALGRSIALRLFQVDYLPTRREAESGQTPTGGWEHNFRFQAGITLRFGLAR